MAPRPLTSRPLDLVYFGFFVSHIFASLCIDFQALYPPALVPSFLRVFANWYLEMSNDPFLNVMFGRDNDPLIWFKSFLFLEVFFQFPTFFIAARGLLNDSRKNYVLMLVYGASTTTTVWPCLWTLLAIPGPSPAALASGIATLTFEQRAMLLSSYVPFCLLPLLMTVDMALRLHSIVGKALAASNADKTK
ncbi:putative membrane protein [Favolaschia claudopus]|uniref:Efficient mitochondria targeting-associated protein 19 n=1 Tax=Favolaschia claudopus TaxID=2862362 RepID=A0AAW0DMQ4_9AGAR